MKVLIAEDDAVWLKVLSRYVANWGYEVTQAKNGTHALQILQRDAASRVALLDWQMPGIDGIDVCRRVKSDDSIPFTYVLMLSSRDHEKDMVAGLDAGADDYLTKPVQPALLRSKLSAAKRIVSLVPPQEWSKPRVQGYEVHRLLGKGAFGTVWEAVHSETGRPVALKILRVDLSTSRAMSRFSREIQLARRLRHPNIARVYDSHIDDKFGYCAMELIEGETLDIVLRQEHVKVRRLVQLVAGACDALAYMHHQGILHRDLKPSNIMITREGRPKLVDFGLSKLIFRSGADADATQSIDGDAIGTPLFMAPEQARGENSKLDARTDIYSLGVILYLLILKQHPHRVSGVDTWELVQQIANGNPRPPTELRPGFNKDLERVLMMAIAREPDCRFQTAEQFGTALRGLLRSQSGKSGLQVAASEDTQTDSRSISSKH